MTIIITTITPILKIVILILISILKKSLGWSRKYAFSDNVLKYLS